MALSSEDDMYYTETKKKRRCLLCILKMAFSSEDDKCYKETKKKRRKKSAAHQSNDALVPPGMLTQVGLIAYTGGLDLLKKLVRGLYFCTGFRLLALPAAG